MEDSDGISVISESEMYKNHSNHSDDNDETVEKPLVEEQEDVEEESLDLLTPPVTPNNCNEECEEEQVQLIKYDNDKTSKEIHQEILPSASRVEATNSHGAVLLIVMTLIIAILYTNISSLKKEFATTSSIYEQRIARLEEENQVLKTQLNELIRQLKVSVNERSNKDEIFIPLEAARIVDEKLFKEDVTQEKTQKPITKDVWMGGEKEDVIKILDKKYNSLPDYCYFTDESDLFYEYNKENCERKKRKLERRVKKFRQKSDQKADSMDEMYSSPPDPSYDEFIQETTEELLKSLNDEIQEIKSSRISTSITDNDVDLPFNPKDDEIIEKQVRKLKDKKKKKNDDENLDDGKIKKLNKRNFNIYDHQQENVNQNQAQDEVKKKRRKFQKQRGVEENSDDWNDRRTVAREEARKKNIDVDEENWFIKRNNEREIHRLDLNVHD